MISRVEPPELTVGVEEEYLLVDRATRELLPETPTNLFTKCEQVLGAQVSPEFLQSQIEIGTAICRSIDEIRADLMRLRRVVIDIADDFGLGVIAASIHPFSSWRNLRRTAKERYDLIEYEYQATARRLLTCGMHVHIGVGDDRLRIDLMNQMTYFLPHLLALSTSSPFWEAEDTGLMSYRLTVSDGLPRSGIPPRLADWHEFTDMVQTLVATGSIQDGSKLWWDIRPSARFPTLETRITDVCTRLDDAVTIAALVQAISCMLSRLRVENQQFRLYPSALIAENRWRAMRYGIDKGLIDFGVGAVKPMDHLIDELIEMIGADVEKLGSRRAVEHARDIARNGTSAHRQRTTWEAARERGADPVEAGRAVVDALIAETMVGIDG